MRRRIRGQHSETDETPKRRRWLRTALELVQVVGLLGVIGFALPKAAFAGEADPNLTITVLVRNYTQVSPAILARAEREAGRILGEAGLRTMWLDCDRHAANTTALCHKLVQPTDLRLSILPGYSRTFPDNAFGFAILPSLASVYFDRAAYLARSSGVADPELRIILGCIIAHEIGHLLLGPNSHAGGGVMQERWGSKQVYQALMGGMLFLPEQSQVMRAEIQMRMKQQRDGFVSGLPSPQN